MQRMTHSCCSSISPGRLLILDGVHACAQLHSAQDGCTPVSRDYRYMFLTRSRSHGVRDDLCSWLSKHSKPSHAAGAAVHAYLAYQPARFAVHS